MPNPFIELPLSNELFNRQQDSTVPPEENLDSSWEFNLDNEYTGNRGSAYQILGGL